MKEHQWYMCSNSVFNQNVTSAEHVQAEMTFCFDTTSTVFLVESGNFKKAR